MVDRMLAVPKELATRASLYVAFIYAKQPARIKQVLNRVYINTQNVDDDLVRLLSLSLWFWHSLKQAGLSAPVDLGVPHAHTFFAHVSVREAQVQSIVQPAQDSSAAECFRLILSGSGVSINRLLRKMQAPLLLLWGELKLHLCSALHRVIVSSP
jgi:hypothetical protein